MRPAGSYHAAYYINNGGWEAEKSEAVVLVHGN